jgi:hypothetical protein
MEAGERLFGEWWRRVFGVGVLDRGAVGWGVPGVGSSMLGACGVRMLESLEGACNVARHGDIDGAVEIVPVEGESAIEGSSPIFGDCVE